LLSNPHSGKWHFLYQAENKTYPIPTQPNLTRPQKVRGTKSHLFYFKRVCCYWISVDKVKHRKVSMRKVLMRKVVVPLCLSLSRQQLQNLLRRSKAWNVFAWNAHYEMILLCTTNSEAVVL